MIGRTEDVEKGLYLRRYGVPDEAIAPVLGMNAMYWYSATQALGRISIVGSTVKDPEHLPLDLAADEKHSWWLGQRIYIAVTVAVGCFLGVGLAATADTAGLSAADGGFIAAPPLNTLPNAYDVCGNGRPPRPGPTPWPKNGTDYLTMAPTSSNTSISPTRIAPVIWPTV